MNSGQVSESAERNVEVGASRIEGLGVFALRSFRAGERIKQINVVREITLEFPLRSELGERTDHCDYPDGKVVLLGFPDRHINHSCDANAYQLYEGGTPYLVARRAIAPGDEISVDYNINITAGTAWPCTCNATRCRGDDRDPDGERQGHETKDPRIFDEPRQTLENQQGIHDALKHIDLEHLQ